MNNSITTDNYIFSIKNSLSSSLCDTIIKRFEEEPNKKEGVTFLGLNKDVKRTYDFHLSMNPDNWRDLDLVLVNELSKAIDLYLIHINKDIPILTIDNCNDLGFQIQKYEKGVGNYIFHNDGHINYENRSSRFLTYIWYLNTIEEGGETHFYDRGKIKPEKGKLCLFPASWTYPHAGIMPISDDKYIITGWIYKEFG